MCVFAWEIRVCVCLRGNVCDVRVCERICIVISRANTHTFPCKLKIIEESGGVYARECVRVCAGTKLGCACARECVRVCEGGKCVFVGERSGACVHVCAGEKGVCLRVCVHVCEEGNAGMWQGETGR